MALAKAEVGARIRVARESRRWTQAELGVQLAAFQGRKKPYYPRTIQRWEKGVDRKTGKSWIPELDNLMDLADLFEIPRSHFVEEEDPRTLMQELREQVELLRAEVDDLRRQRNGDDSEPGER